MTNLLLNELRRHAERSRSARGNGYAPTSIEGLATVYSDEPSGIAHAISKPLICLVLQGRKQVTMGKETFDFGTGDSLLITADVPTVSQITQASVDTPYLSLVMDLNLSAIAELTLQLDAAPTGRRIPVQVEPTDAEVAEAALRLVRLLGRPRSVPVLHASMIRELHYWLLMGRHGPAIRQLGWADGIDQRVARAVAVIRAEFAKPLLVDDLAAIAGMSPSSFYQHFRAITSLSPLQFQKQLRLIEARRLMISEGMQAGAAAFEVGYESVSQFTREYHRMFGLPPAKDKEMVRSRSDLAA
jgi:AraC-like DNA-binding protein